MANVGIVVTATSWAKGQLACKDPNAVRTQCCAVAQAVQPLLKQGYAVGVGPTTLTVYNNPNRQRIVFSRNLPAPLDEVVRCFDDPTYVPKIPLTFPVFAEVELPDAVVG